MVAARHNIAQNVSTDGTHAFLIFFSLLRWERSGRVRSIEPISFLAVTRNGFFLHLSRFGHSFENHVNRRLRILILGQIVAEVFQSVSYVPGAQKVGRRGFQDRSDFIGKRGILKQVGSFRAGSNLDAFAFAQAGQGLQGLAHKDDSPRCFLLCGEKIGQLLLGGFVSFLVIGGRGHGGQSKQSR
jgi:hypothetical protein